MGDECEECVRLKRVNADLLFAAKAIYGIVEQLLIDADEAGLVVSDRTNAVVNCLQAAIEKATGQPVEAR